MLANLILVAKAIHVVGFVSWFAGLFYLGRVLVNHAVALDAPVNDDRDALKRDILHEEYAATAARVYGIIVNPAMMITWTAGLTMIALNPSYLSAGTPGWLWVKLAFVAALVGYQVYTKIHLMLPMATAATPWTDWQLRLWNEVPTFFLVAVPFLATFGKVGQLNYWYLAAGVAGFCFLVYRGAVAYRRRRSG